MRHKSDSHLQVAPEGKNRIRKGKGTAHQTPPAPNILSVIVPALSPCVLWSLSSSQMEEVASTGDPGFIFFFFDEVRVGACLAAAGCPVPPPAAAPPPTNVNRLAEWISGLVVANCNCTAGEITPTIALVRASHVLFNPQCTCTARFTVYSIYLVCPSVCSHIFCHCIVHATKQPKMIPMGSV